MVKMKFGELKTEQLNSAVNILKAIAHQIRIAILDLLENGEGLNVTQIHSKLHVDQSCASHHLGILKGKGVLSSAWEGKNTYYFLKHPDLYHIIDCLNKCC